MTTYLIVLTNGQTFTAERHTKDVLLEGYSYRFRNPQGKNAPVIGEEDLLLVPRESILYFAQLKGR